MRDYYFDAEIDLGSSGVQPFSLADIRRLLGITIGELDGVHLCDSRTCGGTALRKAIARRWGNGDPETVMVTHGSSEAICLVMHALLQPGDEVVVFEPGYQQLHATAEALGCRILPWVLHAHDGFRPDIRGLHRLLNSKTRLVVLNVPHNPTGFTLTSSQEDEIAELVCASGAFLLWDRAFSDLIHANGASCRQVRTKNEISIGTLSKAYGLPGLRVGWAIADEAVIEVLTHVRDYTTLHLSPLVELVAQRVVEAADVLLNARLAQARINLTAVNRWMLEHRDLAEWREPGAGVCGFPRLLTISDVEGFCHHLMRTQRVLLVPGGCFACPNHVRLGFGGAPDEVREGLDRLSKALADPGVSTPIPSRHGSIHKGTAEYQR